MSERRATYVTTPTQIVDDPLGAITDSERRLLLDLRAVDFFRAGKERRAVVHWNGVRVLTFDTEQIRGYT